MTTREVSFRGKAVTVVCTDQEKSEEFYEVVLGGKRMDGDGYGCSWFALGALTVNLMPNGERAGRGEYPTDAMFVLWLEVDDLAAAYRHLLRCEVPVPEYHEDLFLQCTDPDGLNIEIWQAQPDE